MDRWRHPPQDRWDPAVVWRSPGYQQQTASLERRFRRRGLLWLLGLSLVAGQESLQSALWWGVKHLREPVARDGAMRS